MLDESRFGPRARTVLSAANEEAARLSHHYVGTEHILLGLLQEGQGIGVTVLKNLGVDLDDLRMRAQSIVKKGRPENAALAERPFTARARRVLNLAADEARTFGHTYIATEHILLGLLVEANGVAGQALNSFGVGADAARAETRRVLSA
jgi:ATP-dependent Clp protease ATP-binding subunit ClpC